MKRRSFAELLVANHAITRVDDSLLLYRPPSHRPRAMPLAAFVSEVMEILRSAPHATEICVERVKAQRFAEASGGYENFFVTFNDAMHAAATFEAI